MIRFDGVTVEFDGTAALLDVNVEVPAGELCVLLGPSGSGKSTLVRLVNRLVEPSRGRVLVRGDDVGRLDAAVLRRSIGYVIQSIGLFPHRTVARNVATVPRLLGWDPARIARRVADMLSLVRLDPAVFSRRYPGELSGGQAQRVGLARALAGDPDILLMDEPFGAVDPIVRRELRGELRRIHAETRKTILMVTHDPAEALELATRLVVLRDGRVVAAGAPEDLVRADADPFVRALLGQDVSLRRLQRARVLAVTDEAAAPGAPDIPAEASLSEALARMIETRRTRLAVRSGDGAAMGSVDLRRIVEDHP